MIHYTYNYSNERKMFKKLGFKRKIDQKTRKISQIKKIWINWKTKSDHNINDPLYNFSNDRKMFKLLGFKRKIDQKTKKISQIKQGKSVKLKKYE